MTERSHSLLLWLPYSNLYAFHCYIIFDTNHSSLFIFPLICRIS